MPLQDFWNSRLGDLSFENCLYVMKSIYGSQWLLVPAAEPSNFAGYASSIKRLMSNPSYDLLMVSYGLNVGIFYAIPTLLNTVIIRHFQARFS